MKRSHAEPYLKGFVFVGLACLALAGCATNRPHQPDVVLRPAATPREAVVTCYRALVTDDEATLFSVCGESGMFSVGTVSRRTTGGIVENGQTDSSRERSS